MSDLLEQAIRDAYADQDAAYDTTDTVARLTGREYQLRHRRRLLLPTLGAVASLAATAIVAVVVVLSSSTTEAYGAWTRVPTDATASAIATAQARCNWQWNRNNPKRLTGNPVLSEARGKYTGLVFVEHDSVWDCIADGSHASEVGDIGPQGSAPPADKIRFPFGGGGSAPGFFGPPSTRTLSAWQKMILKHDHDQASRELHRRLWLDALRRGFEDHMLGRAGKAVIGVSFGFADQPPVKATVHNGWYFAWWPRLDMPTTIAVTTAAGTTTSSASGRCAGKPTCAYIGQG